MKSGSRGFIQNLFCNFWTLLQVSTNFRSLKQFQEFKQLKNDFKSPHSVGPKSGPRPATLGMVACHARPAERLAGPQPGVPAQLRRRPVTRGNGACAARACSAVTARSSRARRRGDALDGGVVGAGRQQGAAGEHRWGPRVAPGRRSGGGAHPSGGST
jgi:hypothetical protein